LLEPIPYGRELGPGHRGYVYITSFPRSLCIFVYQRSTSSRSSHLVLPWLYSVISAVLSLTYFLIYVLETTGNCVIWIYVVKNKVVHRTTKFIAGAFTTRLFYCLKIYHYSVLPEWRGRWGRNCFSLGRHEIFQWNCKYRGIWIGAH